MTINYAYFKTIVTVFVTMNKVHLKLNNCFFMHDDVTPVMHDDVTPVMHDDVTPVRAMNQLSMY